MMEKLEDLKKELEEIENKAKREQEIKNLKKKIRAKKFAQSKSGKIFNKITDTGEGLGKAITGNSKKTLQKKTKPKSLKEIMKDLPQ